MATLRLPELTPLLLDYLALSDLLGRLDFDAFVDGYESYAAWRTTHSKCPIEPLPEELQLAS